jgi:hypothetical protein
MKNNPSLELINTVVKNNSAIGEDTKTYAAAGGICAVYGNVTMTGGAVYNNSTVSEHRSNDWYIGVYKSVTYYINASLPQASSMSDGDFDFSNYSWRDTQGGIYNTEAVTINNNTTSGTTPAYLTAMVHQTRTIAMIGDEKYEDLSEAIKDYEESGEPIVLVVGEYDDLGDTLSTEPITVHKNLEIDLNGKNLSEIKSGKVTSPIFTIATGATLTVVGEGTIDGNITNNGALTLSDAIALNGSITSNGDLTLKDFTADSLQVTLGNGSNIAVSGSLNCDAIQITLPTAVVTAFNNEGTLPDDYTLITGVTEAIKDKVTITNLSHPLVSLGWKASQAGTSSSIAAASFRLGTAIRTLLAAAVGGDSGSTQTGTLYLHKESVAEGVFLDGVNGDDSNDGLTYNTAVKTFARAKEVLNSQSGRNTIYVINQVTVTADETWSLEDGQMLARYPSYQGNLILISGCALTLSNITIDGQCSAYGINEVKSLIYLDRENAATLKIEEGTVLQNNNSSNSTISYSGDAYKGGAVYASGTVNGPSTIVMNGGTIQNCTAWEGGGIFVGGITTFTMTGGTIQNNTADGKVYSSGTKESLLPSGAGVCIDGYANMIMTGGTIQNNTASYGGGIAVGGHSFERNMHGTVNFEMSGGTITGNYASTCGGGIFIQCTMKATISAGYITNNTAMDGHFAGGGIYVNGGRSTTLYDYPDGVLQLYDVCITDNTTGKEGSGIAGCGTSTIQIYRTHGGVIYGNTADGVAMDIYASRDNGGGQVVGTPQKWITEAMEDGSPYLWQSTGTNSEYVGANELQQKGAISLYTAQTEAANTAKAAAKVFITGNSGLNRGGGIGTNGIVIIGTPSDDNDVTVNVTKTWDDANNAESLRPNYVRIWLLRNNVKYACLVFAGDELEGTLSFTDLPAVAASGEAYVYTVEEEISDALNGVYTATVSDPTTDGNTISYTVTNTLITTGSLTVSKSISGNSAASTDEFTFKVTLSDTTFTGKHGDMTFENGVATVTLKGGESATATDIPQNTTYTVEETSAGEYTSYVGENQTSTATGTIVARATQTAAFTNTLNKYPVYFAKQDASGNGLAGATIALQKADGTTLDTIQSDGKVQSFTLVAGSYQLVETAAPEGYLIADPIAFTIAADGTVTWKDNTAVTEDAPIVMTDALKPYTVSFSKQDTFGSELKGATIQLQKPDGTVIETWVSNGSNHTFDVPAGEYQLVETAAPYGYQLATTIHFTVDLSGKVTADGVELESDAPIVMVDALIPQNYYPLTFHKQDNAGNELSGATIELQTAYGVTLQSWTSDGNAHTFYLTAGRYQLVETSAPEGYLKAEKIVFTVSDVGAIRVEGESSSDSIVMIDEPERTDNPDPQDEPDEPQTPDEPDEPVIPDEPTEPDTPTEPETPVEPETPTEPETPDEPEEPQPQQIDSPKTGDLTTLWFAIPIIVICLIGIVFVLVLRKKKQH